MIGFIEFLIEKEDNNLLQEVLKRLKILGYEAAIAPKKANTISCIPAPSSWNNNESGNFGQRQNFARFFCKKLFTNPAGYAIIVKQSKNRLGA